MSLSQRFDLMAKHLKYTHVDRKSFETVTTVKNFS